MHERGRTECAKGLMALDIEASLVMKHGRDETGFPKQTRDASNDPVNQRQSWLRRGLPNSRAKLNPKSARAMSSWCKLTHRDVRDLCLSRCARTLIKRHSHPIPDYCKILKHATW